MPAVEGRDILPSGRRKRWSSSSPPPSRAKLREVGGSMVTAVATHLSSEKHKHNKEEELSRNTIVMKTGQTERERLEGGGL